MKQTRSQIEVTSETDNIGSNSQGIDTSDLHLYEVQNYFFSKQLMRKIFLNSDDIQMSLHNEIVIFAGEIEDMNERNKGIFRDLIEKMTEAIQKILPDSLVIYIIK